MNFAGRIVPFITGAFLDQCLNYLNPFNKFLSYFAIFP